MGSRAFREVTNSDAFPSSAERGEPGGSVSAVAPALGYRCFRQFNEIPLATLARSRSVITRSLAERFFPSDSLQDRLARELGREKVLAVKEVLESFEFFQRVRKHVRSARVTDLCCGHGLCGILFALFERSVKKAAAGTVQWSGSTPHGNNAKSVGAIAEIKKLLAGIAEKGDPGLKGTAGLTQYSDK